MADGNSEQQRVDSLIQYLMENHPDEIIGIVKEGLEDDYIEDDESEPIEDEESIENEDEPVVEEEDEEEDYFDRKVEQTKEGILTHSIPKPIVLPPSKLSKFEK